MVSNEELRRALRLCMEQMCARCREAADAMTSSVPCLEGCETLKIAKAALAADDENGTLVMKCATCRHWSRTNLNGKRTKGGLCMVRNSLTLDEFGKMCPQWECRYIKKEVRDGE